ncbi:MAG: carboxypeptidase-like regulatory domain-containing protein, partial [Pseudomonadota bacterium]
VRFKGPRPEGERHDLPSAMRTICGPFKRSLPYVVTESSKLAQVVLWLDGGAAAETPPTTPLVLNIKRCEWQPELATATRGQVLVIGNLDAETQQPLLRWHDDGESATPARRPLHMWIPSRGQQIATVLRARGLLDLTTTANRPWLHARVRVFDHTLHTTSGERGDFEIGDVAPGPYTLHAWHPTLGETSQEVVIQSGRDTSALFTYTPDGPEPRSGAGSSERVPTSRPAANSGEATHAR